MSWCYDSTEGPKKDARRTDIEGVPGTCGEARGAREECVSKGEDSTPDQGMKNEKDISYEGITGGHTGGRHALILAWLRLSLTSSAAINVWVWFWSVGSVLGTACV
ncbi:hypothetical protein EI94DRAFT_1699361 [Lactarius quietus]|nr:hypothetical protein EI94DRAFT_1699361 [Lactarius quietus]